MRRRPMHVLAVGIGVASVLVAAGGGAVAHPRGASPLGVLVRANSHQALPLHGGTVDSLNWSGYAVTPPGGAVTAVASTFVVPTAGLIPPGFAATWAGIGGFSTNDLIQAGTSEQSLPSLPLIGDQYFAWYELLPGAEVQLAGCAGDANCTVNPGDAMSVSITQVATSTWAIAMSDAGHWTWSHDVKYNSSRSSAEWILEAPTLIVLQTLIAPVGTASFGPTSTYTAGGVTHTIAQGNPTQIVLTPGLINEATPSPLANGQSFNDCAYAQACAAP